MPVAFFNPAPGSTPLAGSIAGQFKTPQYEDGSITNVKLAGGITIDKLSALGTNGQLLQSDGTDEIAITPPLIFSNIDESGLVVGGVVQGTSSGYTIGPINTLIDAYVVSKRAAVIQTLTLTATYGFYAVHNLGTIPFYFRAALYCNTSDNGYAIGTEINIDNTGVIGITTGYDATYVYAYVATSAAIYVTNTSGVHSLLTLGSWYIKFYLSL
jgi:hypothetical protein